MNTTGNLNTTHTVVIAEPPSKGLRFLVGLAMLYAFWVNRRLIAGFVFSAVAPQQAAPEGFAMVSTVTGVLIPLLVDFVVALGGGGIFAATMGWRVFSDLAAGAFSMIANWRNGQALRARVAQALTQAQTAAGQAGQATATAAAVQGAARTLEFSNPELAKFAAMVQGTLADIVKRQGIADELLAELQTRGSGGTESSKPPAGSAEGN
jgi:hypothetical protein